MKNMTCKEIGGNCNFEIRADTSLQMTKKILAHLKDKHPEMAKKMQSMTMAERDMWEDTIHANFHKN